MALTAPCRTLANLAILLLAVLAVSACRAESMVTIEVARDGSGIVAAEVYLDPEATAAVGDLDEQLRYEDLVDAGWSVDSPVRTEDGGTRVTAAKGFEVPGRLGSVLGEILGPTVFEQVELVRRRSFATTVWQIAGTIDVSRGLELFSDPGLRETLSGLPLGRTEDEIASLVGCDTPCDPAEAFTMELVVVLPGETDTPTGISRWTVQLGDQTMTPFELSSTTRHRSARLWLVGSLVLAGLAVVALATQGVRVLLGRRVTPATARPVRARRRASEIIEQVPRRGKGSADRSVQLVVVGGTGVLWEGGTGPEGLLVPFVRERGGITDSDEIADRYRSASLGQVSTAEFWSSVEVVGDPDLLDGDYLARVALRPDARPFLEQMAMRGLAVACMTNAVLSWAQHLRRGLGLEDLVTHWVVSAEVGARKPSNAMFEALRRMTGVAYPNMLLVDSDPSTLEAGRGVGMSTVLMRGRGLLPGGFAHPMIDGFTGLFRTSRRSGLKRPRGSTSDPASD
ncbi:MAG: HAD-IA family hydrolase [Actinomycetota bacterium]|nr:HAD-IA family hydrolase [Actinomycetota bacterium]